MRIISSIIQDQVVQADGTISVVERHLYDNGEVQLHSYLADPSWNLEEVANARATNINLEITRREEQRAAAMSFSIPYTKAEFRELFTVPEQIAIDNFNLTYQSNPLLTNDQKLEIMSSLEHWKDTTVVYLTHPRIISIVNTYETLGLIAQGRAIEVLSNG